MSKLVRNYLIQDLTINEHRSYVDYIRGNHDSTDWITKANKRRDSLLRSAMRCLCGSYISIRESGICKCSEGHDCYDIIIPIINSL